MQDSLVDTLSATEPRDLRTRCGNVVAKCSNCARKSPIWSVRISNCGDRSGIGKLSTLEPCIGPFGSPCPKYCSPVANVRVQDSLTQGFEQAEISKRLEFHQGRAVRLPESQRAQPNQNPLLVGDATVSRNGLTGYRTPHVQQRINLRAMPVMARPASCSSLARPGPLFARQGRLTSRYLEWLQWRSRSRSRVFQIAWFPEESEGAALP